MPYKLAEIRKIIIFKAAKGISEHATSYTAKDYVISTTFLKMYSTFVFY